MKTEPLYLSDPYIKNLENVHIIEVIENGNETALIFDKTIFYPMGGGQATDQGWITLQTGEKLDVYQVQIKDGEILNFIKGEIKPNLNDIITLELNWDRRYKNMKLHSAGHIIDFAIFLLGYTPDKLSPMRGDHNKDLHIQYSGIIDKDFKLDLQNKVNEMISQDLEFYWEFVDFETLKSKAIYLQPNLPVNKPLRMLELKGIGAVADGGTIVKNTSEVEKIEITSIDKIDGNTIVRYRLV